MSNKIIKVQNIKVNIANVNDNDYICISDFGKYKEGKSKADDIIRNWLRNRITLEFLGTWESIYNPNFNSVEFDGFRKSAGLHTFTLSVTEWCDKTNAIGIYSKRGKYGGTYAHKDIAFEFLAKSGLSSLHFLAVVLIIITFRISASSAYFIHSLFL